MVTNDKRRREGNGWLDAYVYRSLDLPFVLEIVPRRGFYRVSKGNTSAGTKHLDYRYSSPILARDCLLVPSSWRTLQRV